MKKLIILGATGSIGGNAIDVVMTHPDEFKVVAVSALRSREKCEAFAKALGAKAYVGEDAALRAVEENEADVCLVATVGMSGIAPTVAAIGKGMDIALATKEVMVMAGERVTALAKARGVRFLPVDSEHSAIFQCLSTREVGRVDRELGMIGDSGSETSAVRNSSFAIRNSDVDRLILTASGGPFLDGPEDLSKVTVEQALNHPRWKMGPKVTVDSATMMNKGFEIIEARWLFDIPVDRIDVVVHPESVVHSLVTFSDGATLAQLSPPDMRVAIQYALTWPDRLPSVRKPLDLPALGRLTFRSPDPGRFPCLRLVKEAVRLGGDACARLAAADEVAVARFLKGEIGFTDIPKILEESLGK